MTPRPRLSRCRTGNTAASPARSLGPPAAPREALRLLRACGSVVRPCLGVTAREPACAEDPTGPPRARAAPERARQRHGGRWRWREAETGALSTKKRRPCEESVRGGQGSDTPTAAQGGSAPGAAPAAAWLAPPRGQGSRSRRAVDRTLAQRRRSREARCPSGRGTTQAGAHRRRWDLWASTDCRQARAPPAAAALLFFRRAAAWLCRRQLARGEQRLDKGTCGGTGDPRQIPIFPA